jgi:hypothetical protein
MHEVANKFMHSDKHFELQKRQHAFKIRHPDHRHAFGGDQYIFYNKVNDRPFPRGFDEKKFLRKFKKVGKLPYDANDPAKFSGVKFNIGGNGHVVFPIPTYILTIEQKPVRMQPLFRGHRQFRRRLHREEGGQVHGAEERGGREGVPRLLDAVRGDGGERADNKGIPLTEQQVPKDDEGDDDR